LSEEDLIFNTDEGLFKERSQVLTSRVSTNLSIPNVEIMDNFEMNIYHRGQAYMNRRSSNIDENVDVFPDGREKSTSLYIKSSECENVTLD
jgi:hypothetical protein